MALLVWKESEPHSMGRFRLPQGYLCSIKKIDKKRLSDMTQTIKDAKQKMLKVFRGFFMCPLLSFHYNKSTGRQCMELCVYCYKIMVQTDIGKLSSIITTMLGTYGYSIWQFSETGTLRYSTPPILHIKACSQVCSGALPTWLCQWFVTENHLGSRHCTLYGKGQAIPLFHGRTSTNQVIEPVRRRVTPCSDLHWPL